MTTFPDDGLCDFLLLESVTITGDFKIVSQVPKHDALRRLRTYAKATYKTTSGISFSGTETDRTATRFKSPKAAPSFSELWSDNIRAHGVASTVLSRTTSGTEVEVLSTLFKALHKLQRRKKNASKGKCYLVLGVTILNRGTSREVTHVRALFEHAVSKNKLDVVVLRVDYHTDHEEEPDCRVTGPNAWNGSTYEDQPTYLDTLKFLKTTHHPKNVMMALSLSAAAHFYQIPENNLTSTRMIGNACTVRTEDDGLLVSRANMCDSDSISLSKALIDTNSVQRYITDSEDQRLVYVYDDKRTIHAKMCWVTTYNRKWRLGWYIANIDMADDVSPCDSNATTTFPLIRYMQSRIEHNFHKPEVCPIPPKTTSLVE